MKELDISDVARQAGLTPSALRFYENKGLIRAVGRKGLRRQYHQDVLNQLALIALGRKAGFTLQSIASMFDAFGKVDIDRKKLLTRADEIDITILQLKQVRNGLRHIAACPSLDHMQCPEFQKMLRGRL